MEVYKYMIKCNNKKDSDIIIKDDDEKKLLKKQCEELQRKYNELERNYNKLLKNDTIELLKRSSIYNKTEEEKLSVYDEEFDLKKMAKGAKAKSNSQDNNIDHPWSQIPKEKYKELDGYYQILEYHVRKLLETIQINEENKNYIEEIITIINNN